MNLTIKGVPRSKKNSMVIARNAKGRPFIMQGQSYQQYEKDSLRQITGKYKQKINAPVNVKCIYYMPNHKRVDLGNLLAATMDVLVKAAVLEDDNAKIVVGHDGSCVLVDKENPRVEVTIEQVEVREDAI